MPAVQRVLRRVPEHHAAWDVSARPHPGGGDRALFAFEKKGEENSCVLCAFAVYGGSVPDVVYQEEFSAVTPKSGQALASWAKTEGDSSRREAFAKASGCDLSVLA